MNSLGLSTTFVKRKGERVPTIHMGVVEAWRWGTTLFINLVHIDL